MKIKQKNYSTNRQQNNSVDNVYSKNPRFKIQNLMRSKVIQLNQKCLLTKSYRDQFQEQQKSRRKQKQKIKKICGIKYKDKNNYSRYQLESDSYQNIRKIARKNHKTQINIQTIDIIKQEISRTLVKDLLSLKNMQQSLLTPKKRYSQRKKYFPTKKRNFTINYNQCYNLAQKRQLLNLNTQNQQIATPKLEVYDSKNRNIAPLIYFLKKKQLSDRNMEGISPTVTYMRNKIRKGVDESTQKKICQSHRQRTKQVQKFRQSMFSPWQVNHRNGVTSQTPQQIQFLKYNK